MIRLKYQPPPIHPKLENGEENQVFSKNKKVLKDDDDEYNNKKTLSDSIISYLPSQTQVRKQEIIIHSNEAKYRSSVRPSIEQRVKLQKEYVRQQLEDTKLYQQEIFTKKEIEEMEKDPNLNVDKNAISELKIRVKEKNKNKNTLVKKFIMDYDANDDEDYGNYQMNDDDIDLTNKDPKYLKYINKKNKEKDEHFLSKYDDEKLLELHMKQLQDQLDFLQKEEEEEIFQYKANNNPDTLIDDDTNENNELKEKINQNLLQLIKIKQQKIYSSRKKNYKVPLKFNNENHPYHLKFHASCSHLRAVKYALEISLFQYPFNFPKLSHTSVYMSQTKSIGSHYVVRDEKNKGYKNYTYILPWLILGKKSAAQDLGVLLKLEISHILNMTYEVTNLFPNHFIYERVSIFIPLIFFRF